MNDKITSLILCAVAALMPDLAQSREISARVVSSEDSIPVQFSTVRLIQPDSVTVATSLTDKNGRFNFENKITDGMYLAISSVGFKKLDVDLPCDSIIFLESSNELSEVVVRASKKYVKGIPRGLQITMEGNPIAKLGSAIDAIKQLPMIDSSGGGISVLGHGKPLIYINNRLVRSMGELSNLSAENISNVEIITNPSSRYGSDVSSVILIRLKKLNEGFHAVAAGSVAASEEWSESGNVSLNYHTESGITVLGDFSYGSSGFKQKRHYSEIFYAENNPDVKYNTDTYADAKSRSQSMMADAGINYDFGKNSVGVKYTFRRTPKSHYTGNSRSTTDYRLDEDEIASISDLYSQNSMHHVNTFGNFSLPAKIGLRIDADYVKSSSTSNSGVDENNSMNNVSNSNVSKGSLWACQLVLSRKFHKLEMEAGTDISYTHSKQDYMGSSSGNQDFITPETDEVRQRLYAAFVGFDLNLNEKWNAFGGVRLESTNTDFRQNLIHREDLSKSYTDWLPNLGISFNSSVGLSLYYRANIYRPGYTSLDNTYVYVTPTLWETGNAELRSTLLHRIGLNFSYKKFFLQSSFTINRRNMASVYRNDAINRINVVQPINLPDYNSFQVVAVQQLDLGFWHPTLQGVFYIQNLKYGSPKRRYNKPIYTLSFNNRFDIPGGFYAYFYVHVLGAGNQNVVYTRGTWTASITLNKTWRNWTFTLSAGDIFNTWRQKNGETTNTVDYSSYIKGASRSISLSIRYTLNTAKGKYKGKTSRQDEINRL